MSVFAGPKGCIKARVTLVTMVTDDHIVVMTRQHAVGVAELKARLSAYLRAAQRGSEVVIRDRNEPIARLVPYESVDARIVVRDPVRKYGSLAKVPLPGSLTLKVDAVQLLLEERRSGR